MILPRTGDRNEATSKGEYDSIAVDKLFDYGENADIFTKGLNELGDMTLGSILRGYNAGSDFVMGDILGNPEYQRDWSMDDDFFDALGLVPAGMGAKKGVKLGKKGFDHVAPLLKGKAPKGSLGRSFGKMDVMPSKKLMAGGAVAVPTVGAMSDGDDSISQEEGSPTKTAFSEIKDIIGGNKEDVNQDAEKVADPLAVANNQVGQPNNFDNPAVDTSSAMAPKIDTTALRLAVNKMLMEDQNTPGGLNNSNTVALRDLQKKLYQAEKKNKRSFEEDEILKARGIPVVDGAGKPIPFEKRKQMVRDMVQTRAKPNVKQNTSFDKPAPKERTDSELQAEGLVRDPETGTIREPLQPSEEEKARMSASKNFDSLEGRVPDGKGGYSQRDPKLPVVTKSSVDVRDDVEGRIPDGFGGYSQPDPLLKPDPILDKPAPIDVDTGRSLRYQLPAYTQMGDRDLGLARSDWNNRINKRAKEAEDKRKAKRMGKGTSTLYNPSIF